MRSSMKMRSRLAKWRLSISSPLRMRRSWRRRASVLSTLRLSTSLTERKQGLLLSMTQQLGLMLTSQSVQA